MIRKYRVFTSTEFEKDRKKAVKRDSKLENLLQETVMQLEADPYKHSERLKGNLNGKRRIPVGQRWRVIFLICEECKELEEEQKNDCYQCDIHKSADVIVSALMPRKRDYRRI